MKQKDLITYGLIALGIYLITKPKEPKTSEVTSDEIYTGDADKALDASKIPSTIPTNIANS